MKLSERLFNIGKEFETNAGLEDVSTAALEAADLLDECEALIVAMRQEIQNLGGSLEGVITADATLAKLRAAQDKADE